ncbi:major capsid protein [Acidovorax sp. BL-A-41-H1]|uniref:major capsid protein n=1 Tax=Acidovorax sp. BL-A-41-H1 TaxID=3421102 RepID=UPI003F7AA6EA
MNLFLRAKQAGARYVKNGKRVATGAAVMALASAPAFAAAPAQPDVTDVVAYMTAAIGTVVLLGNARLLIAVAVNVFRWVRGAMR